MLMMMTAMQLGDAGEVIMHGQFFSRGGPRFAKKRQVSFSLLATFSFPVSQQRDDVF